MTDISNWADLVHLEQNYVMVPMNEYQMGNLVDALAQVPDTGDWWGEILYIVAHAMKVKGVNELRANMGCVYTLDQIYRGDIREKK